MAIDPNNPPTNSQVNATMRDLIANVPSVTTAGSLNLCWVESGTDALALKGLYITINTTTTGGPLWAYVGGYGVSINVSNYLVFGRTSSQTVSEVVNLGTAVHDGGDGGWSVRISSSVGKRCIWVNYDEQAIFGADDELNVIQGGQRNSVALVNDADYPVVDGTAVVVYTAITDPSTRTVTLPASAASQAGRIIIVKDGSGLCTATAIIRVSVSGGATIEGSANVDITTAYGMRAFLNTGSAWIRLGSS